MLISRAFNLSRNCFRLITLGLLLTAAAKAQILHFEVSPSLTSTSSTAKYIGQISLAGAGSFTAGSNTAPYFAFQAGNMFGSYVWIGGSTPLNIGLASGGSLARFAANDSIGSSVSGWTSGFSNTTFSSGSSAWFTGGAGYVALRIDAGSGNYNYGWAAFNYNNTSFSESLTLTEFAFETTLNQAIAAGDTGAAAVPEPGTTALGLSVAAFALYIHRRKSARKLAAS